MKLNPIRESDKPEILKFSRKHEWKPAFPEPLVIRFLTELISSSDMVFDLHDGRGRAATAVLLDQLTNASNDANLEILGVRKDVDPAACVAEILNLAYSRAPRGKAGFQISLLEHSPLSESFLKQHRLKFFYATYEMENSSIQVRPVERAQRISSARRSDSEAVFKILSESFSKNPEASIPHLDAWNANFLSLPLSHTYLWKEESRLTGFANLVMPAKGASSEVRTIGVLSESRGKGIGRDLLQHCLNETVRLGFQKCHLSVAVENEKALALYLATGFTITEKYRVFRGLFA